jgi:dTDP-4-dehydrorhamnose reductase
VSIVRILVTGAAGMLGRDAVSQLERHGHDVTALSRRALDITDPASVGAAVVGHDAVLNCAAWTAVDDAEQHEAEAFGVNAIGPAVLARAAARAGARLVHVSTDYVFDGDASTPYPSDAPLRPRSAYGRTKAAGEWAVRAELPNDHLIVRTAWLYGAHGSCFPKTIARVAAERGAVAVVDDQLGQPTWTVDVADFVERLVVTGAPSGTYHATASGQASWFELAQEVCDSAGLGRQVVKPTTSAEFVRPAPRPSYSVLGHEAAARAGVPAIADWRERWLVAADGVLSAEGASSRPEG